MRRGEIILGARRPPRARSGSRRILGAIVVAVVLLLVARFAFYKATSYSEPEGEAPHDNPTADGTRLVIGAASLERVGEIWLLRASGKPFDVGAAHGRLLAPLLGQDDALDAALDGDPPPSGFFSELRHNLSIRWRYRSLDEGLSPDRRAEVAGLAAGLRASSRTTDTPGYHRLVRRQAAMDVGRAPGGALPFGGVTSGLAFVSAGNAEAGGALLFGRIFSLPAIAAPKDVVISLLRIEGKIPFAQVGWPGAVGAVTGVNAEGIIVAVNPAVAEGVEADRGATPVWHVARTVLEQAHSLDEALSLIKDEKPLGAASYLVVDARQRKWAVVERSPRKTSVTHHEGPAAIGDILTSSDFEKDAENDRARRSLAGTSRQIRLTKIMARDAPRDLRGALSVLRDRMGPDGRELLPGNGNAIDDPAAQHAVLIDGDALRLWVSEGPGASGRFVAIDLRPELRGEILAQGRDELPPRDEASLRLARRAAEALAELRRARAFFRRGHKKAAHDAVVRTLTLSPWIAPAHKLAADLARAGGDDSAARAHLERFLELDPSDPGEIAEARQRLGLR